MGEIARRVGCGIGGGVLCACLLSTTVLDCRPGTTPQGVVEAGAPVATGVCSFLEGVLPDGTIATICATVEEILLIVSVVAPLIAADGVPEAGTCTILPGTTVCATRAQVGRGIAAVLQQRRARLMIDAGLDAHRSGL
jgi:hypothetical protein